MSSAVARLRERAVALERETYALAVAYRDPRTPWYGKAWALLVVAYAVSPIDLIPDFIPVIGYLDDLLLVPLGIWVALRLIPPDVLADARRAAAAREPGGTSRWLGVALVAMVWIVLLAAVAWAIARATGALSRAQPPPG